MAEFYCPYCNPAYTFKKQRADGIFICGQCGDELVRKRRFKPIRILGIVATFAFVFPTLLMISSALNEQKRDSQLEKIS